MAAQLDMGQFKQTKPITKIFSRESTIYALTIQTLLTNANKIAICSNVVITSNNQNYIQLSLVYFLFTIILFPVAFKCLLDAQ